MLMLLILLLSSAKYKAINRYSDRFRAGGINPEFAQIHDSV